MSLMVVFTSPGRRTSLSSFPLLFWTRARRDGLLLDRSGKSPRERGMDCNGEGGVQQSALTVDWFLLGQYRTEVPVHGPTTWPLGRACAGDGCMWLQPFGSPIRPQDICEGCGTTSDQLWPDTQN